MDAYAPVAVEGYAARRLGTIGWLMRDPDPTSAHLTFGVLGPVEATFDGAPVKLGGRQQRAVLAMLICHVGTPVTTDQVISGIWPDPAPGGAVTSVQTYVFHLRRVLEPDRPRGAPARVVERVPDGYRLTVDRDSVDLHRFEDGIAAGDGALRRGDLEQALAAYDGALSLWRGEPLSDVADFGFAAPISSRLEELRLGALESRMEAALGLGRHQAVVAEARELLDAHPLREGLHAQLILALYRSGRQGDALASYRALRELLADELGVEPSPALQALHTRVLGQDPSLDLARPQQEVPATRSVMPDRASTLPRRRGRMLAVLALAVIGLAGGATIPEGGAPARAVAVPANAVTELDADGRVVASVPVGTHPSAIAVTDDRVWVVNDGDDTVSVIDPETHSVRRVLEVGSDPRGLAVAGGDLWVTSFKDGRLTRIDVATERVTGSVEVGSGPDAIAAGPAGLWVANSGDNTIQRIDPATGIAHRPVDVGDGPDGLLVDDTSVWVANGRDASVWRMDARSGEPMTAPVAVGSGPRSLAQIGQEIWVADALSQSLTRISIATYRTSTLEIGEGPTGGAALGGRAWVAAEHDGRIVGIDPDTDERDVVDVRTPVHGLAVAQGRLWISSGGSATTSHRGGTLVLAAVDLPGTFSGIDPATLYDIGTSQAVRGVYDGLLAHHYGGADAQVLVPDLAMSVPEPTDGDRTYTFTLRAGIRYSTGATVRASDVKRGVRRALLVGARPDLFQMIVGGRTCVRHPARCDLRRGVVTDDAARRITFHLTAPDPLFLNKLTWFVWPTPAGTPMTMLTTPMPGTGPYQISSYRRERAFALDRNPYFREWSAAAQPAGFVDEMRWHRVPDTRAAVSAVRSGQADLAELTPIGGAGRAAGTILRELRRTVPDRLRHSVVQATTFGVVNSSRPPFDHRLARRAFSFAIDRRRASALLGGHAIAPVSCQLLPPSMPSYEWHCPYSTGPADAPYRGPDLARARKLVRRSGTAGARVSVVDLVGDYNPPLEPYLARVLRRIGYRATVRRVPFSPAAERWFYDADSGIQVESGAWIADFPVPANFYNLVDCDTAVYPFAYCNRGLDRRATEANSARESDPAAALRTWTAIDRAVTNDAPLITVASGRNWWLTSERVGNYQAGVQALGPLLSKLWVR